MYCDFVLTLGITFMLFAQTAKTHGCGRLLLQSLSCCNKKLDKFDMITDDMRIECFKFQNKTRRPCDFDRCIGKKLGYTNTDGILNRYAFAELVSKIFASYPDLVQTMKTNCIYADDLTVYGKKEICDFIKVKICLVVQFEKNCHDWRNDGACLGMKDLANICNKKFDRPTRNHY